MSHASLQSRVIRLDSSAHNGGLRQGSLTMVVMHASEDDGPAERVIAYLNTTDEKTASYHYVIDRDGGILRMTAPNIVAYHAGDSDWPSPKRATPQNPDRPNGGKSVNRISVGICWANNARNTGEQLTVEQIESGLWLCALFAGDYKIPVNRVLTHSQVSPGRKFDPDDAMSGEHWRQLLTEYLDAA